MTTSISPVRTARRIRPGGVSGTISPEIQTFVSTATRSAGSPHLADGGRHVALDIGVGESTLLGDALAPLEQLAEAPLPLVLGEAPRPLRFQPRVDGLSNKGGDRFAAALAQSAEERELLVIEINIRALHRPYIIHHI
jgi:hypothetical protein